VLELADELQDSFRRLFTPGAQDTFGLPHGRALVSFHYGTSKRFKRELLRTSAGFFFTAVGLVRSFAEKSKLPVEAFDIRISVAPLRQQTR
jgi:hypothetical protein